MQNQPSFFQKTSHHIQDLLEQSRYPVQLALIGSAVIIGAVTGLAAIVFIWLLAQINQLTLVVEMAFGVVGVLAFMAAAGFIVVLSSTAGRMRPKGMASLR
ncbi:MAG: hypothetical protein M5U34_05515 [Chloroflexi bacterium]|nr:hypothetical protein [Chloroflexota bacterium]